MNGQTGGVDGGTRFLGEGLVCQRGERRVFTDVSFSVSAGGALLLVGPNGSGKSSLLRLMAGLLAPAAGRLLWNDVPLAEDPEAHGQRLHYVGHLDALKPALSACENLAFWIGFATGRPMGSGPVRRRAEAALDRLGIGRLAAIPARLLSAGQKRRVTLARLLAWDAPLWLLDEPATALDVDAIAAFKSALDHHRKAGGLAVISTHADLDLPEAATLRLGERPGGLPS